MWKWEWSVESCMSDHTLRQNGHFSKVTKVIVGGMWCMFKCCCCFIIHRLNPSHLSWHFSQLFYGWVSTILGGKIANFNHPKIAKSIQFIERIDISYCYVHVSAHVVLTQPLIKREKCQDRCEGVKRWTTALKHTPETEFVKISFHRPPKMTLVTFEKWPFCL